MEPGRERQPGHPEETKKKRRRFVIRDAPSTSPSPARSPRYFGARKAPTRQPADAAREKKSGVVRSGAEWLRGRRTGIEGVRELGGLRDVVLQHARVADIVRLGLADDVRVVHEPFVRREQRIHLGFFLGGHARDHGERGAALLGQRGGAHAAPRGDAAADLGAEARLERDAGGQSGERSHDKDDDCVRKVHWIVRIRFPNVLFRRDVIITHVERCKNSVL